MPSLQKFQSNVARHVKLMDKNLCASLIRHEHIVTTRAKAKRAQAKIEKFLSDTMHQQKQLQGDLAYKLENVTALKFLQPPDRAEIGSKVLDELVKRYPNRLTGFTRIIKLEPRLGEDKAPMSVLELVDSEYEIKFWYTAKIVARLQLQGLVLDDITQVNVDKLTKLRTNGVEIFEEAVKTCKETFFKNDPLTDEVTDVKIKKSLENKPNLDFHGGSRVGEFTRSKKHPTIPRAERAVLELPKSPFLAKV